MIKNNVEESKKFFENAEELVAWEGMLSIEEAKMILGYIKGHGYEVCLNTNKDLLLVDLEEPENEPEAFYDVTDLMARISQWNYEFLLDDTITGDWHESIKRDASIIADLQERVLIVLIDLEYHKQGASFKDLQREIMLGGFQTSLEKRNAVCITKL